MSLNKPQLVIDLGDLYDDTQDGAADAATAKANFVNGLADIIDGYVKSATINYTNGLTSATGGIVSGIFNGNLS